MCDLKRRRLLTTFLGFFLWAGLMGLPPSALATDHDSGFLAGIKVPILKEFWKGVEIFAGGYYAQIKEDETIGMEAEITYKLLDKTVSGQVVGFYGDIDTQGKAGIGMEYINQEFLTYYFPFEVQHRYFILGAEVGPQKLEPYLGLSTRGSFKEEQPPPPTPQVMEPPPAEEPSPEPGPEPEPEPEPEPVPASEPPVTVLPSPFGAG